MGRIGNRKGTKRQVGGRKVVCETERESASGLNPFEGVRVGATPMHGPRPSTWRLHLFSTPLKTLIIALWRKKRARNLSARAPASGMQSASMHLCDPARPPVCADQPHGAYLGQGATFAQHMGRGYNPCPKRPERRGTRLRIRVVFRHGANAPRPVSSQIAPQGKVF